MAPTGRLSEKKRKFIAALLTETNVRNASKAASISERSAWRWLASDEGVKAELVKRQDALLRMAVVGLAADMSTARETLRTLMTDWVVASIRGSSVRCRAAIAVLDSGMRFLELLSVTERIGALERALTGKDSDAYQQ